MSKPIGFWLMNATAAVKLMRGKSLSTKFKWLKTASEDPLTEVHLLFYTACLPLFANYNLFLQRGDSPKVYLMTKELIRKIASLFLKTSFYHGEDIIDENIMDDADNFHWMKFSLAFHWLIRHSIILYLKLQVHSIGKVWDMFWIKWTYPVLFGNKQSGLAFSIKAVPSGHMLSISSIHSVMFY